MNKSFIELVKEARTQGFTPQEKQHLRSVLVAHMQAHPVRVVEEVRHIWQQRSPFSFLFTPLQLKTMPVILVIMLLVGGGTSFAAEGALPGDALYPVKVYVNEAVRSSLTFSAQGKAHIAADLTERRLEEAEKLEAEGRLDTTAQARIEENFKEHAARTQERIERLEEQDKVAAAEVSSKFEASLKAHEDILARMEARSQTREGVAVGLMMRDDQEDEVKDQRGVGGLRAAIKEATEATIKTRIDLEAQVRTSSDTEVRVASEGKAKAAAHKLEEVKRFVEAKKERIRAEVMAEVNLKLEAAEKAFVEARVQLEAKAYGEAFALFQESMRLAQEAKLMLEAHERFDLDVEAPGLEIKLREESDVKGDVLPPAGEVKGQGRLKVNIGL